MKHTPGPWAVNEGRGIVGKWEDGTQVQVCSISHTHWSHPTGKPFPDPVTLSNNERMSKESTANARLIAAAPEMLESLKALTHLMQEAADEIDTDAKHPLRGYGGKTVRENIFAAREAIAKAEG
jgi:hypothetical protein